MRGCNEGMWTNARPFNRLSGLPVVTVTVTVGGLVSVGGRQTISCWNSCFERSDDVFKESESTLILFERPDR